MIFSIFRFFLHPQIPDLQILSKPYINGNIIYSAKSQFQKMDPYDWFSGPGSARGRTQFGERVRAGELKQKR